jgi:predicted nucleic acid-binding protein
MPVKAFFDTNVLICAVAEDDPRSARAEDLLSSGGALSVQILNAFVSVARRKILMSWSDVTEALDAFRVLCPSPLPITIETDTKPLLVNKIHVLVRQQGRSRRNRLRTVVLRRVQSYV